MGVISVLATNVGIRKDQYVSKGGLGGDKVGAS